MRSGPITAIAWFDPEFNNNKLQSIGLKPSGVEGKVVFRQESFDCPVKVTIDLSGLTPLKHVLYTYTNWATCMRDVNR